MRKDIRGAVDSRVDPKKKAVSNTPPPTGTWPSANETKTHVAIMTARYADVASELRNAMYLFGDVVVVIIPAAYGNARP
jgi:hypothetical protein